MRFRPRLHHHRYLFGRQRKVMSSIIFFQYYYLTSKQQFYFHGFKFFVTLAFRIIVLLCLKQKRDARHCDLVTLVNICDLQTSGQRLECPSAGSGCDFRPRQTQDANIGIRFSPNWRSVLEVLRVVVFTLHSNPGCKIRK